MSRAKRAEYGQALTGQECEVVRLVAAGLSNAETASGMLISVQGVKNHLVRVYDKLGLRDRAQLMLWAQRQARRAS